MKNTCLVLAFPLIIGMVTPISCWAQSEPPVTSTSKPDQALQVPAGKFIQDLGDQTIRVIADKNIGQEQRTKKYEDLLRSAFDLQTIGHFVIGRAWNTATPEQQQEYMKLFEQLVIKIYGDRLNFYSGESFHVKSVHQEDNDIVVGSEIDHPGGAQPTLVDWRVRQTGGKLAIVDVIIAGVSQSVTQRQEYSSIIQRDGGKIDGLLDVMRQRVQEPSSSNNPQ